MRCSLPHLLVGATVLVGCSRSTERSPEAPGGPLSRGSLTSASSSSAGAGSVAEEVYSKVGQWGPVRKGLQLRLSAAGQRRTIGGSGWRFRLEMRNASDGPIEIVIEERGYFGSIGFKGKGEMWLPPAGKWRDKEMALEPGAVIACEEYVLCERGRKSLRPGVHQAVGYFCKHYTEGPYVISGPIDILVEAD